MCRVCDATVTKPRRQRAASRVAASSLVVVAEADSIDFESWIDDAMRSLPDDLRRAMSNVEIVVDDEPPPGMPLLGLYQGVPLTARTTGYAAVPPDKITIYRGPLERLYGADRARLREQVRRVVLHEIAHHFGISDERLIEIDRY